MSSPYEALPPTAFWRRAVTDRAPGDPGPLYQPVVRIKHATRLATAGSCFAQRIGQRLRKAGCRVIDAEAPPAFVPDAVAHRFGYRQFSARYGNIYTARHLAQLLREAFDGVTPENWIWEKDGRYFDALRPAVEPEGLETPDLVRAHRTAHLERVRLAFTRARVLIFTFGQTECWLDRASGTVFPTAPGTIAGRYDPARHVFHNCAFQETLEAFEAAREILHRVNPGLKFIVTVSPVPMTATASGLHVEVANTQSKAILRTVCGELTARHKDVDYFPSFEMATSLHARGRFFGDNLRTLREEAVDDIMACFFAAHGLEQLADRLDRDAPPATTEEIDAQHQAADENAHDPCEDELLDKFAK